MASAFAVILYFINIVLWIQLTDFDYSSTLTKCPLGALPLSVVFLSKLSTAN